MNFKKTILYLLSSIFVLIFIYNFVLPYMSTQNTTGMGMHMNYTYYSNSYYYYGSIINFFIFELIVLLIAFTIIKIFTSSNLKKCKKCGLTIEKDEWQICPRCGNPLPDWSVKNE